MSGRDSLTKLVQADMEITRHSMGKMYVCQVRLYFFWVPLCRCQSFFPSSTSQSHEKGSYILNMQLYDGALRLFKQETTETSLKRLAFHNNLNLISIGALLWKSWGLGPSLLSLLPNKIYTLKELLIKMP